MHTKQLYLGEYTSTHRIDIQFAATGPTNIKIEKSCQNVGENFDIWSIPFCIHGHICWLGGLQLKGYIGERRGEREEMQDAHTIINDLTPQFMGLPNEM